ncbi:MAG: c-type cytochrome [Gammaproteobacteria bacterium]|nr:c-type cytochrome [Gammaproteobacteria bacterium]
MAIAIAVVALLVATVLFHILSPWQLTPLASNWGAIDATINLTFWVTGLVLIAVNLFMAWCIVRYRYNKNRRALYEPEDKKLEAWLIGLSTLGIIALLAPGLVVWNQIVHAPDDAHEVEVVASQWHWYFRYPGEDGVLGRSDPSLISDENPLGIDPNDPNSLDDIIVTTPRGYLPVDRPVKLKLRSRDVLHNFKVANFRVKMDIVPGQVTGFWFTPTRVGDYDLICAQLCGIGHFAMRGSIRVVEDAAYDAWLASQPTFGEIHGREAPDLAAGQRHYANCIACHGADGQGNQMLNSPAIAGMEAWYTKRQLEYFRNGARGAHEDDEHGRQMVPFARIVADPTTERDLAAYIEQMPPVSVAATVDGDAARGERLYRTCGACHGRDGQGLFSTNAPRLAGLDDWYQKRQLQHFQTGVRGGHPDDLYGPQMRDMSKIIVNDDAMRNVLAYINSLTGHEQTRAQPELAGRNN